MRDRASRRRILSRRSGGTHLIDGTIIQRKNASVALGSESPSEPDDDSRRSGDDAARESRCGTLLQSSFSGVHVLCRTSTLRIGKAARKLQFGVKSGQRVVDPIPIPVHTDATPEVPVHDLDTEPGNLDVLDIPGSPSESLMEAMEATCSTIVSLRSTRRLPFLLRNLRTGFEHRCQLAGVDTSTKAPPQRQISIIYSRKLGLAEENQRELASAMKTSVHTWLCPLCDLHDEFGNREMLHTHLCWDHSDVKVTWDAVSVFLGLRISSRRPSEIRHLIPRYICRGCFTVSRLSRVVHTADLKTSMTGS